ncbi:MAG: 50S ribosomal protein L2 [Candidatus Nanoarchaeia archaeon]|nr:50S ribosomal protein L2 [Candidatus Haiyanarchaeum thermophilum]MCW1303101.1 50S ribosomal protein L2 [Candidatus Haiyanarchaeum thermophilum]MCW1303766.1 50S ribosomal protein L2 [Candidatus Haiyanarchaeum thermophilum]MCW1306619.1 50S ribosomal protein L2 [Candidatus Haiyanarchaeum thermophilum]MCW1307031.1 50S ribosomal protein L2 [Candidatus Haiyanarchaeum thermophilum]
MPKRLRQQRRGKGKNVFRAPAKAAKVKISYGKLDINRLTKGKVVDLIHDALHSAPIAKIRLEDGKVIHIPAALGIGINDEVEIGVGAKLKPGNVLPLSSIPDGMSVFNLELKPGDGGKLVRASGTSAQIISHEKDRVIVQLPSRELKPFNPSCLATIGVVAGGGRTEKPFTKAGAKHYAMKRRGKYWPRVRGVAMVPAAHPFGGKRARTGRKSKSVSRRAPPGAKVGSIAARRTGRRK